MEKVRCRKCGSVGYTASPEGCLCKCGGHHKKIKSKKPQKTY